MHVYDHHDDWNPAFISVLREHVWQEILPRALLRRRNIWSGDTAYHRTYWTESRTTFCEAMISNIIQLMTHIICRICYVPYNMGHTKYFIWFQNLQKTGSIIEEFEISKLLALSVYMSTITMLLKWGFHLMIKSIVLSELRTPKSPMSELRSLRTLLIPSWPQEFKLPLYPYVKPKIEHSLGWERLVLFNGISW